MTDTFYPTFRYHPTEAPHGRKFTDAAEYAALSAEWVDTPTKFPVPEPDPISVVVVDPAPVNKGRKKAREA